MTGRPSLLRAPWAASLAALALLLLAPAACARAAGAADFYKGKTVTIQVGYGPGGGYDLIARIIAQFYGQHIPGNPRVIVQNVPGGGGLVVANSIYNTVPRDGLTLGVFSSDAALEPLYGDKEAHFKPGGFAWIGSMDTDAQSCGVWKAAGTQIKTLPDLIAAKRTITFGSTSPTAPTSSYPLFFGKALGAPVKVINGYTGTKEVMLAMQRGELDATCGLFESTVRGSYMQDLRNGDLKIFVQITTKDDMSPLFGDATPIMEVVKGEEMRQAANLVFGPSLLTRPLAAPPGTPRDRVAALRAALLATANDPETIAAAKKVVGAALQPKSGAEVEKMIAAFQATPPELVKKAYAYSHD